MNDFDGAVQRPTGLDATGTGSPVGMADLGARSTPTGAESAVGMEDASAAGTTETGVGTPSASPHAMTDSLREGCGLSEEQVLGRAPLPETES